MNNNQSVQFENQSLKEIIEIGKQITTGLDIRQIVKNVCYILNTKFDAEFSAFILPSDFDDFSPVSYLFEGRSRKNWLLNFPLLTPLLNYFKEQEYNQISFKHFKADFKDRKIIKEIENNEPDFIIPLKSDNGIVGLYLQGAKKSGEPYSVEDIHYCNNIISFATIAIDNANLYRKATVDQMTKLYTHHQFMKRLDEEIAKSNRYGNQFSLMMFDIDKFKSFNDNYGHLQGDIIIKELAKIVLSSIREVDFPSRYGGEEFAVILPEISLDSCVKVAERLRRHIENYEFPGEEGPFKVTISMGVIEFDSRYVKHNSNIIEPTDKALYLSKAMGRNRVSIGSYTSDPRVAPE